MTAWQSSSGEQIGKNSTGDEGDASGDAGTATIPCEFLMRRGYPGILFVRVVNKGLTGLRV
jgi:hypothetical protein